MNEFTKNSKHLGNFHETSKRVFFEIDHLMQKEPDILQRLSNQRKQKKFYI